MAAAALSASVAASVRGGRRAAAEATPRWRVLLDAVGDDERRERQADWTRSWDPARLAHVMRGATRANLPERDAIAMITAPTLILAWTGDPIHPVTTADELARLLPHADVHIASTAAELATWTDRIASFITAG